MQPNNFNNTSLLHAEVLEQVHKMRRYIFLLLIIVAALSISNIYLATKKNETIRYVEFSTKGNFGFKVLPDSSLNVSQRKLLIEQQLENYVVSRVTNVTTKVNGNSNVSLDAGKIKFISSLSSRAVTAQYQDEIMRIYNESEFLRRDIEILSSSEIQDRQYRFDFKTIDTYQEGKTDQKRWVVYINYDLLNPNNLPEGQTREQNPLGIRITYYRGDLDKSNKTDLENAFN